MLNYSITIERLIMTATVRLDDNLEEKLNNLSHTLHKKKSDVIRDAISFYFNNIEKIINDEG